MKNSELTEPTRKKYPEYLCVKERPLNRKKLIFINIFINITLWTMRTKKNIARNI